MALKEQLLSELDTLWNEFRSLLVDLDELKFEKKWLDGRWGVRELAAYHTGWLGQFAGALERMIKGERSALAPGDWADVQRLSDTFAEHARGKQKGQVLQEMKRAYSDFKEAAERLPEEQFTEGQIARQMFDRAGIADLKDHIDMIRSWREREGITAARTS